ncbi:hypothetical protein E3A20_29370, partial [Planctomyces bekefii]
PAEFQAAAITAIVAPPNIMICCQWLSMEKQIGTSVVQQSQTPDGGLDRASDAQLFALCALLANSSKAQDARNRMMTKLGVAVQDLQDKETIGGKTNSRKT